MAAHKDVILDLKNAGNAAHQRGEYRQAILHFSKALELSPPANTKHVLHSNRSASYCLLEDYESALEDALEVVRLNPEWAKGYSRKGAALHHSKRYDEAIAAYTMGLELDPDNEVMKKAMQEAVEGKSYMSGKPFSSELLPATQEALKKCKELRHLAEVSWHLEIIKDKIWLADPPKAPFRPRSLFIIDSDRLQMLNMTAHPSRDSISLDELADFILQAFFKTGIRPGLLEFSDAKLHHVLQDTLHGIGVRVRTTALSQAKQKFFDDTVRCFEEKEREQWATDAHQGKFAGVLKQRNQKGLMSVDGMNVGFFKSLLSAAAGFIQSRVYLYYSGGLGIQVHEGSEFSAEASVCIISKNPTGQWGISHSTQRAYAEPGDCGTESYLFCECSNIPFDDCDLIEKHGCDIVDDKYPLPLVHGVDAEQKRPSLEVF